MPRFFAIALVKPHPHRPFIGVATFVSRGTYNDNFSLLGAIGIELVNSTPIVLLSESRSSRRGGYRTCSHIFSWLTSISLRTTPIVLSPESRFLGRGRAALIVSGCTQEIWRLAAVEVGCRPTSEIEAPMKEWFCDFEQAIWAATLPRLSRSTPARSSSPTAE